MDKTLLGIRITDPKTPWNRIHDMYLDNFPNPTAKSRARQHYQLCMQHGLGYIGPEWHYKHYGKKIFSLLHERPILLEAEIRWSIADILFHILAITIGEAGNSNVLTKRQHHLRWTILDGLAHNLFTKNNNGFDEESKDFCWKPLPKDAAFIDFIHTTSHMSVIHILEKHGYYFGLPDGAIRDQWVFDLYQIYIKCDRFAYRYIPEHSSSF